MMKHGLTPTGYENTFDIRRIKIDTEDYYSEYLGFDTTSFIPKDVDSYTRKATTYYKLKENCNEKLKTIYKPAAISWSNLHKSISMEEFLKSTT